ncbi:tyrosine-type recombinase/integrase [Bradyrhizobium sp.]|uniref:tyrosine-type recombinase/integrase n=1 Tax=Bradyrhizobium sp. TaxID=376 RepID=UPI000B0F4A4E|nr:tyrosine-type recombinase/integrase [Bradyrhizobium sp.]
MPDIDQRYFYEDTDRHGKLRRYFRKRITGSTKYRKVRLREQPGTAEFLEEFAAAMAGRPYLRQDETPRPAPPKVVERSLRWLIEKRYFRESLEFRAYDTETQKVRRRILSNICDEPWSETDKRQIGDLPCDIPEDKIKLLLRRKAATSIDSANAWLKALRKLSEWAVAEKLIPVNRAAGVDLLPRLETGGWHTWTLEEIAQYQERHPAGSKARLALALFLFSGQRLSDVARLGKQFIRRLEHVAQPMREIHPGRWLAFRQFKNRNRAPVDVVIPMLPQLEDELAAAQAAGVLGAMTFLETEFGKPYSTKGLGNWFERRCLEAGVPGRAHGLRKAGATIAAENGATPHQLMAIFGWKTLAQAELYTEKARRQLLAGGGMGLISVGKQSG